MTPPRLPNALTAGFERLAAWSDLLDAINVFPVADGDTGRNLVVTLTPLKDPGEEPAAPALAEKLLMAARGNSGNIAARFLAEFLAFPTADFADRTARAGQAARAAVHRPREGTMLTLFDALAADLAGTPASFSVRETAARLDRLARVVAATRDALPQLKAAGVVDAGALGMFLFFESFFGQLAGMDQPEVSPLARFGAATALAEDFKAVPDEAGYCVDVVLRPGARLAETVAALDDAAAEVVTIPHGEWVKLHFHTRDGSAARRRMEAAGQVVQWEEDDLTEQTRRFGQRAARAGVHLVTDAAASLTRADQQRLEITLLESYIHDGRRSLPETRLQPEEIYRALREGVRVSTAQASIHERHQFYQRLAAQYPCVIYLCVGSAYTGNFEVATQWGAVQEASERFIVVDSGAASGRLAVMAIPAARLARAGAGTAIVLEALRRAMTLCREYIFLDRLKYLVAGGRLSRPGAFFGDLLRVKPIISPMPAGVERVAAVRSAREQVAFALKRLEHDLAGHPRPLILLQYSDNEDWLRQTVAPGLQARFPLAELVVQPLSLTTGVHTGPGSWAVALHPEPEKRARSERAAP